VRTKRFSLCVALSGAAFASVACIAEAATPTIVLDENCYLRHYCQFGVNHYSAAALKAEGEAVLGKAGLDGLRRETERALEKRGIAVGQGAWQDHVDQPMYENFAPPPPGRGRQGQQSASRAHRSVATILGSWRCPGQTDTRAQRAPRDADLVPPQIRPPTTVLRSVPIFIISGAVKRHEGLTPPTHERDVAPSDPSEGRSARSALSARPRPGTPSLVITCHDGALGNRGGGLAESLRIVATCRHLSTLVIT